MHKVIDLAGSYRLHASFTYSPSSIPEPGRFEFGSSDEAIIMVAPDGTLAPVAVGTATVVVRGYAADGSLVSELPVTIQVTTPPEPEQPRPAKPIGMDVVLAIT